MKPGLNEEQEFLKSVGTLIKELRKEKGYKNYEYFAFDNEIARAQYFNYEKGQNMTLLSLARILKAHDITLAEFFARLENKIFYDPKIHQKKPLKEK